MRPVTDEKLFSIAQAAAWIGSSVATAIAIVVFVYSTFQTKSDASATAADVAQIKAQDQRVVIERLDRMGKYLTEEFRIVRDRIDRLSDQRRK